MIGMTDELQSKWKEFGARPIANPVFDPSILLKQQGVNEHMMYAAHIGKYRCGILADLEAIEGDIKIVAQTKYGVDAAWKLFWRSLARFFLKRQQYARARKLARQSNHSHQ
jgi:hypothetical protein